MAACLLFFCSAVKAQSSPLEIAARNKATTLKSYADFNTRHLDDLTKLYAPEFVDHTNAAVKGPEGVKADFLNTFKIWPDVQVRVEQIVAEGDWVMVRCVTWATHTSEVMGLKPTNKKVEVIYWSSHRHNKDGLIIESWNMLDNAALMQQLGLLP